MIEISKPPYSILAIQFSSLKNRSRVLNYIRRCRKWGSQKWAGNKTFRKILFEPYSSSSFTSSSSSSSSSPPPSRPNLLPPPPPLHLLCLLLCPLEPAEATTPA
jgi:hypothetical protein